MHLLLGSTAHQNTAHRREGFGFNTRHDFDNQHSYVFRAFGDGINSLLDARWHVCDNFGSFAGFKTSNRFGCTDDDHVIGLDYIIETFLANEDVPDLLEGFFFFYFAASQQIVTCCYSFEVDWYVLT